MPEVLVYAAAGRSDEQKRALCKDITAAVVKNFKVDVDAVVVSIMETPRALKMKGGVMFDEMKPKT